MYYVAEDLFKKAPANLKREFQAVLDSDGSEEDVQRFLAEHPEIIGRGFIRMVGFLVPKLRFGADYVADFLVADWRQAWCLTLIELEPKDANSFNKDGTPARRLAQAMKQLAEWNQWIEANRTYFGAQIQPHVEQLITRLGSKESHYGRFAHYLRMTDYLRITSVAIIGRRGDDFPDEQARRAALSRFTRDHLEVLSYDWLLDLLDEKRAFR